MAIAGRYPMLSVQERRKVIEAIERGIAEAISRGGYAGTLEPGGDETTQISLFVVEEILGAPLTELVNKRR